MARGGENHKVLQKGQAKDTKHSFSYGHAKVVYKSNNNDVHSDLGVKPKLKIDFSKCRESQLTNQEKKTRQINERMAKKVLPKQKFHHRRQSFTAKKDDKMAKDIRKTHFTFGNDIKTEHRRSVSQYLHGFQNPDLYKNRMIAR
jgi:hypothetical protein